MNCPFEYKTPELSSEAFRRLDRTTVLRSPDSPTGYVVTFRYYAPELDRVGVIGDWLFSDAHTSSSNTAADRMPHEWRPGDFQHKTPGLLKGRRHAPIQKDVPVKLDAASLGLDPAQFLKGMYDMQKDPETNIFLCTIPLPSGTFLYQYVTHVTEDVFSSTIIPDPTNPPFEYMPGEQRHSSVTIPYLPGSGCEDRSIELPYTGFAHGTLQFFEYEGIGGVQPATVYLPYSYDPNRAEPYPTLYISHGGNGHHSDWVNQGRIQNMLDHLLSEGALEHTVVVMMESQVYNWGSECIPNILEHLIPAVEENFNVSTEVRRRAFAGLSMGGMLTFRMFAEHTDRFDYYGIFSAGNERGIPLPKQTDGWPKAHVGFGLYEGGAGGSQLSLQDALGEADLKFTSCVVPGGHQWSVWRKTFIDFARHVLWK